MEIGAADWLRVEAWLRSHGTPRLVTRAGIVLGQCGYREHPRICRIVEVTERLACLSSGGCRESKLAEYQVHPQKVETSKFTTGSEFDQLTVVDGGDGLNTSMPDRQPDQPGPQRLAHLERARQAFCFRESLRLMPRFLRS